MRALALSAFLLLAACGAPVEVGENNQVVVPPSLPGANEAAPAANAAAPATGAEAAMDVSNAIPQAFRGVWDRNDESCARPSEYRLTVEATELRFHESIGKVRKVRIETPERIQVFADYQGEGETWQNVRLLELGDKELTISGEGTEIVRVRCPDAEAGGKA